MNRLTQGLTVWIVCSAAAAADAGPTIEPQEKWSGVFADSDVTLRYAVAAERALEGRVGWRFSIDRRTILRGELPVNVRPGQPAIVAVPLRIPHVKEGVIVVGQLEVAVSTGGTARAVANHVKPLRIFPHNPFAGQSKRLEALKITLFDPEGKTAEALEKMEVPFTLARRTAVLEGISAGLLLIGEGTSLDEYRSLPETLSKVAASGVPVLCLAPADGSLAMPGAGDSGQPIPKRLALRRRDVIGEFDKRLDSAAWPPDGRLVASRLAVQANRRGVVLEILTDGVPGSEAAWPWIEVRYPKDGGTLLICGFGIIRQWEDGPVPRFLLACVFERLTDKGKSLPPHTQED